MRREVRVVSTDLNRKLAIGLVAALCLLWLPGCATTSYIQKRNTRENPLTASLALVSNRGPHESQRTSQLLERYDLTDEYKKNPNAALLSLCTQDEQSQESERLYAVAELAYIQGQQAQHDGQAVEALHYFQRALASSYAYLFSPTVADNRNPYDPQFRGACDLYNQALEDTLRLLHADGQLQPGKTYQLSSGDKHFTIKTRLDDHWDKQDFAEFDHFEFASDYEIKTLNNRHTTYGLGVPLIAIRKQANNAAPMEKYYPDMLSFACTALLQCSWNGELGPDGKPAPQCELVFYNPMRRSRTEFAGRTIPLETDITTPLAYFLDNKQFHDKDIATLGLLKPTKVQNKQGLFMLEAYDPKRIPVTMVHGLWSSPMTWMDMFNDLRSFPEVRERYQFWFYLYPTGQPFWISAVQMRKDMKDLQETIDQHYHGHDVNTMEQMVLVGHSMGGLVSRLQTLDSGNDFWKIVSEKSIDELNASDEDQARLASTLFFRPNPSVSRVITIGTPHHGSDYSNSTTQWLGRRFIKLPAFLTNISTRLIRDNPDYFRDTQLLTTNTSIDSLAPDSPIFPVMMRAQKKSPVKYHNVVGLVSSKSLIGRIKTDSDGVVERESAELPDAVSQIFVEAQHTEIHTKPAAILEVRRILMEHAKEIDSRDRVASLPYPRSAVEPVSVTLSDSIGPEDAPLEIAIPLVPDGQEEPAMMR